MTVITEQQIESFTIGHINPKGKGEWKLRGNQNRNEPLNPRILIKTTKSDVYFWLEVYNEQQLRDYLDIDLSGSPCYVTDENTSLADIKDKALFWIAAYDDFILDFEITAYPDYKKLGAIAKFIRSHDKVDLDVLRECKDVDIALQKIESRVDEVNNIDTLIDYDEPDTPTTIGLNDDGTIEMYDGTWEWVTVIVHEGDDYVEYLRSDYERCGKPPTQILFTPEHTTWHISSSYRNVFNREDSEPNPSILGKSDSTDFGWVSVLHEKQALFEFGVSEFLTVLDYRDFGLNLEGVVTRNVPWLGDVAHFIRSNGIVGEAALKFCGNLKAAEKMLYHYIYFDENIDVLSWAEEFSKKGENFTALLARNNKPILFKGIWKRKEMTLERSLIN